jgi:hypothetical protein
VPTFVRHGVIPYGPAGEIDPAWQASTGYAAFGLARYLSPPVAHAPLTGTPRRPDRHLPSELQPQEAVASVTRIPAPDVADKGAASTRLWDLDQPLLHGMELTAASNVGRPGLGCSPPGCADTSRGDPK